MSQITPELALQGLQATAAASDAFGSYSAARAARSQALTDAMLAEVAAADAMNRAATEAAGVQAKGIRRAATSRAQAAGSGFTTGVGTAGAVEGAGRFFAELEAAAIRERGRREALGEQTAAGFARAKAKSISPWADAAGSLLGSAAKVGEYWARRKEKTGSARKE